jgi:hypothetical protein
MGKIVRRMWGMYVGDAIGTVTFKWLRSKQYYVKRIKGHSCGHLSGVLQMKFAWRERQDRSSQLAPTGPYESFEMEGA